MNTQPQDWKSRVLLLPPSCKAFVAKVFTKKTPGELRRYRAVRVITLLLIIVLLAVGVFFFSGSLLFAIVEGME